MAPREAGAGPADVSGRTDAPHDVPPFTGSEAGVIALSTGSAYTYGLGRVFRLAADAGYEGVEVIVDERWDTRQPTYLKRLARETGVAILSIHGPFPSQRIAGWPSDEVSRVTEAVRLCEAVGARTLNLHLPERFRVASLTAMGRRYLLPFGGATPSMRRFSDWLTGDGLAEAQAATSVRIVIENLPMRRAFGRKFHAHRYNDWESFRQFRAVCLDTTHLGTTGSDLLEVAARLGGRIAHVHLSDFDGRNEHLLPGRGMLPLEAFVQWLGRRKFEGTIVIELSPHGLAAHDEVRLASEFAMAREYVAAAYRAGATVDRPTVGPVTAPGAARSEVRR
jgi:sugar phosphate isomerase/epimerase